VRVKWIHKSVTMDAQSKELQRPEMTADGQQMYGMRMSSDGRLVVARLLQSLSKRMLTEVRQKNSIMIIAFCYDSVDVNTILCYRVLMLH
jgi:hypothetical protein